MQRKAVTVLILAVCAAAGCRNQSNETARSMLTTVQRRPWSSEVTTGVSLTSRNYRIYTTSTNRLLVKYLPGFMEASLENYLRLTFLAYRAPDEPMPIYLMGTRREWAVLTRQVIGRHADTYLKIEAGGYCYQKKCVFWDIGGMGTLSVSAHEGLHQFLKYRLRDQLPMWMEEGLATMAEGYEIDGEIVRFTPKRNVARFSNLRAAIIDGYWIPLPKLLPMDGGHAVSSGSTKRAVGYYGQLWALQQFLRSREDYRAALARLVADAEAGRLHQALKMLPRALAQLRRYGRRYNLMISEPVFRYYITDDLDGFEKEFLAFATNLALVE